MVKLKKANAVIIVVVVILTLFGYAQYKENQKYERYLSRQLFNNVSRLSWSTVLNGFVLDDVLTEKKITQKQLSIIQNKYSDIRTYGGQVIDLASQYLTRLNVEEYDIHPYPLYMASDVLHYLDMLERDKLKGEEYVTLSAEEPKRYKLMKSINNVWVKSITENIKGIHIPSSENVVDGAVKQNSEYITTDSYRDIYRNNMVNSNDWIEMIREMQRSSEEYERQVENLF